MHRTASINPDPAVASVAGADSASASASTFAPTRELRPYELADGLRATQGTVWLTGTQALVRLMLMQRALDDAAGLKTAGFVSGYRGSPLGMVDQQMWKASKLLQAAQVQFLPAINEDLAATACLGTQRVALDPKRRVDGVYAMWYGKGPGVDRAGDALKHGHVYGSSPQGGVLVVCGDDHGCVSSSMPHQSDTALMHFGMPVLHPANVAEYLEFGLYGWALSRFSGAWVGFKAISEVVESGMTVDLDAVPLDFGLPVDFAPSQSLHVRAVDLPSLALEQRAALKLDAVRAFARVNTVDKHLVVSPRATLGIVTVGKAHYDFMEVLRRLDLDPNALAAAGVRVYKVGLVWPLEPTRLLEFVHGLEEVLVIEEKGAIVERQMKELLYGLPDHQRPRIAGKLSAGPLPDAVPLLSALGELRPSRVMPVVAEWLARLNPALDRRSRVVDFTMPALLSNEADVVRRQPYFCSGCPHNRSTRVPEGSKALAGIGCHFMASWMERRTEGLIQMGAEGVDWVAASRFTDEAHVFQNLGDGTYFHSGLLAIRQAVAAGARMTYKILYNDAVAMTGGQPVDGQLSVAEIARQVQAEGSTTIAIVSDDIAKYDARHTEFPPGTTFHDRSEMDAVQRRLRELPGVTLLIYDQTCAAEKRRRRRKGELEDPKTRVFINPQVCEGCGDCGVQSNCLSIVPLATDWGRKRAIEQSSCNKDYSCVNGFCPSFVTLDGAVLKQRRGMLAADALARELAQLREPAPWMWTGPFDLMVTGVGGTGVVTVGALVTMAAHLEGQQASVLDFMGFAQKGGAVLSFVRLAPTADLLNQVRIDTQQADLLLACDLVVGAGADALGTVKHGRTEVIANHHEIATAAFVRNPDATLHADALMAKLRHAAGAERVRSIDAQGLADELLGDTLPSNIVMLGAAWQAGLVPVSLAALQRAIELNGVAVDANRTALAIGRLALAAPQALVRLRAGLQTTPEAPPPDDSVDGLVARRIEFLTAYQDAAYAQRYADAVARVRAAEVALGEAGAALELTRVVAFQLARLMAIKDEYEVARLHTDETFQAQLRSQFERWERLNVHLAPPGLSREGPDGRPRKRRFGPWVQQVFKVLARLRRLRGTVLDVFGRSAERRMERALIGEYLAIVEQLLQGLTPERLPLALQLAQVASTVRGFGPVKAASVASARAAWASLLDQWHGRVPAATVASPTRPRVTIPLRAA